MKRRPPLYGPNLRCSSRCENRDSPGYFPDHQTKALANMITRSGSQIRSSKRARLVFRMLASTTSAIRTLLHRLMEFRLGGILRFHTGHYFFMYFPGSLMPTAS